MPFRLAWSTDLHLNFLTDDEVRTFCSRLRQIDTDVLVISGDIAESSSLDHYLTLLVRELEFPVYFVLGNHDFYRSSISRMRRKVAALVEQESLLRWLTAMEPVELVDGVGIVGHDGWADGRLGDYDNSEVLLNDYLLIDELSGLTDRGRKRQLAALGDEAAAWVRQVLPPAVERFQRLYFVTHVPPFREACWHEGGISNDQWLPHFASGVMGEALTEVIGPRPDCEVTVLCGHTHSRGVVQILPNLVVRTGGAVYGSPTVEELIEL